MLSPAIAFRADLVQAGGCSFSAEVTADFGEYVQVFGLDCTTDDTDSLFLTVTSPQSLCGITATVTEFGGQITYDGMAMDFGLLANGNLIPAAAPAVVSACWSSAYISAAGNEGDRYRVTYEKNFDEKKLIVETWYEKNIPIYAEICYNNMSIIRMTIRDFSFN